MRCFVVILVSGCQPFVAAGVGVTPTHDAEGLSISAGGGAKDFTIGGGFHLHELGMGEGIHTASATMDFNWTLLRWKAISTNIHAGPAITGMVDTMTADYAYGYGVHYGGGVALTLSSYSLFVDFHRLFSIIDGGPAPGANAFGGTMLGFQVRR